jgi:hypothetical protein
VSTLHLVFTLIIITGADTNVECVIEYTFNNRTKFRIKYYLYSPHTEGEMKGDKIFHLFIYFIRKCFFIHFNLVFTYVIKLFISYFTIVKPVGVRESNEMKWQCEISAKKRCCKLCETGQPRLMRNQEKTGKIVPETILSCLREKITNGHSQFCRQIPDLLGGKLNLLQEGDQTQDLSIECKDAYWYFV